MCTSPAEVEAGTEDSTPESVVAYLVELGAVRPNEWVNGILRAILASAPEGLAVMGTAERLEISRRTLGRRFHAAGLFSPLQWIGLARAINVHRAILIGASLKQATCAAGYSDQFTMSNALHRTIGLRPSRLHAVSWRELIDRWIARQRVRSRDVQQRPEECNG